MNYDCVVGELKDRLLLLCRTVALYLTRLKFILMKKLLVFFMALLLPLFALKMSADDENAIIKIPCGILLSNDINVQRIISYYETF